MTYTITAVYLVNDEWEDYVLVAKPSSLRVSKIIAEEFHKAQRKIKRTPYTMRITNGTDTWEWRDQNRGWELQK